MNLSVNPRQLFISLMSIVVLFTLLSLSGILQVLNDRFTVLSALFELNSESTISTWYATVLFLIATLFSALITWDHTGRNLPHTRQWGYLTIAFLLMSIDEIALLHDRLFGGLGGLIGGGEGVFFYAWVIPGLVIVLLFALFYAPFFLKLPRATQIGIVLGLGMFVFGAVGMEMISGWIISNYDVRVIVVLLLSTVEEFAEMVGMCVVIWGLAHYLRDYCTLQVSITASEITSASSTEHVQNTPPATYPADTSTSIS